MTLAHWLALGIAIVAIILSWRARRDQREREIREYFRRYQGPLL